ncbi:hypothetical protein PIB30_054806, partial [Stylosanthes scabra]|nr:hypothetical protein [Stylosanthes scabra]
SPVWEKMQKIQDHKTLNCRKRATRKEEGDVAELGQMRRTTAMGKATNGNDAGGRQQSHERR